MNTVTNTDDLIDSRDLIERQADLEHDIAALADHNGVTDFVPSDWIDRKDEELPEWLEVDDAWIEYKAVYAFGAEFEDYAPDYHHGETAIRDSYFKEYAQDLAEDIGAVNSDASWPNNCIDWDQAAHELQMDYSAIEFDGQTYWVR